MWAHDSVQHNGALIFVIIATLVTSHLSSFNDNGGNEEDDVQQGNQESTYDKVETGTKRSEARGVPMIVDVIYQQDVVNETFVELDSPGD